jgi:hemerythrin
MSGAPKNPPALPWTDSFCVGVEALDNDHRALVRLINDVCEVWDVGEEQRALAALDVLCELAGEHFRKEEAVLRGLPGFRNLLSHSAEHRNRLKQLIVLRDRIQGLSTGEGEVLLRNDLVDWFVRQSIGHDAAIKAYFDDRRPSDIAPGTPL